MNAKPSGARNRNTNQQQAAQYQQTQQMAPQGLNMSLSQGQQQSNGQAYQAEQENLKSYISDLKKAAGGNKKSRGNASNVKTEKNTNVASSGNVKLNGSNRSSHAVTQGFNHPQTTKNGSMGINMLQNFSGDSVQGGNNPQYAQQYNNILQLQQQQIHQQQKRNVNTSKSQGGNMLPEQHRSTQSRGGSRGAGQQSYNNVSSSQNFPQGMMAPVITSQTGNSQGHPDNSRVQSRQQSRQNYQSYGGNTNTKDKTSQLLKNYEQIIRKEKQGSNQNSSNSYVGQNTNLMKRIGNGSNLNNKSLEKNQNPRGQRSQSNLRKSQGGYPAAHGSGMNLSSQKFFQGGSQNFEVQPNTTKNNYGMSAQSGLSRALKQTDSRNGYSSNVLAKQDESEEFAGRESNRAAQKDVIIRSNSSKKFLRPTSQSNREEGQNKKKSSSNVASNGQHYRNKTQVVKKNVVQNIMVAPAADLNNSGQYNNLNSPNPANGAVAYGGKAHANMINTDSTHANSDAAHGSTSGAQKRMRQNQNYITNMSTQAALNALAQQQQQQQLSMQFQNSSVGSGGTPNMQMIDENQRREVLLKNAKSLGNSLGTANKKSLNLSNNDKMLAGVIDRDQSTLNEGQFFTLAKTGLLNNLNLSQLIRSQNFLEEDGIEDIHFYFVSFNSHKNKVLDKQERTMKRRREQQKEKKKGASNPKYNPKSAKVDPKKKKENIENENVKTIESCEEEELT